MAQAESGRGEQLQLPDDMLLIDDFHLGRPHIIGTYVLLGDQPALVDPGPASTLPSLEEGLHAHGLRFEDVRVLLLTHIHLDHAGATGTLVHRYPHLRVYVHERGAPHMIAPERLIRSATRLYGEEMDRLWGEIRAVPEQNVTVLKGGESVVLGERMLNVFYAPGHASHHVVYFDERNRAAFVGDVAGVRIPGTSYVRPPTPPPDIDVEAWQQSLDLLLSLDPRVLLPTHFGPISTPAEHVEQLRERLLRWADIVRQGLAGGEDEATQIARLQAVADAELGTASPQSTMADYQQATPIEQSWQGLARYWRKRAEQDPSVLA